MRMKLWALPAVLRVAVCSQHAFSVFDDVLAFPQYQVSWPDSAITGDEAAAALAGEHDKARTESTATHEQHEQHEAVVLHGQRYLCSVPVIAVGADNTTSTSDEAQAQADTAGELVRARERGRELLEGMRGQCIYYLSGWWSYSFCYQDEVRQFHQLPPTRGVAVYPPREDPTVHSYILGRFPSTSKPDTPGTTGSDTTGTTASTGKTLGSEPDDTPDSRDHAPRLESSGATRYMAQRLPDGTPCDLTGRPRTVDVHFHCNPASADRITIIKETSTCAYLIVIDTPRLCHDVAFLPPQHNLAHPIACRPVVNAADVADVALDPLHDHSEHDLANTNPLRDLTDGLEGSTRRRPVIGGIEVGAHALVGSEGKVIEKSVIVGGGKEVYVATVADSEGHQMAKEEMKKLGIRDPADVDEFKANVKRVAGRKAWKLDLVDTLRGREFRGIIETEDSDELEGEAKGDTKAKDKDKDNTTPQDTPETSGSGSGSGSSTSPSKEHKPDVDDSREEEEEEEEEESHSGTEEVYKDEL
jgi:protein OS-9